MTNFRDFQTSKDTLFFSVGLIWFLNVSGSHSWNFAFLVFHDVYMSKLPSLNAYSLCLPFAGPKVSPKVLFLSNRLTISAPSAPYSFLEAHMAPPANQPNRNGACTRACMHACMLACMHAWMQACMHVCMHACMYACMHTCSCHANFVFKIEKRPLNPTAARLEFDCNPGECVTPTLQIGWRDPAVCMPALFARSKMYR